MNKSRQKNESDGLLPIFPGRTLPGKSMLACLIISLASLQLPAAGRAAENGTISFVKETASVKEILKAIEQQTEFRFFYNHQQVDVNRTISVNLKDARLTQALEEILRGTAIRYLISGNQILLFTRDPDDLESQRSSVSDTMNDVKTPVPEFSVTGTVTDGSEPLPGVNVIEQGTTNGTTTDASGRFSINVQDEKSTLAFSFIGYVSQVVPVNGRAVLDITMTQDIHSLDEVVVVGYGTTEKSLLTGAISSVSSDQLNTVSSMRVDQALQGRIAGVNVLPTSGSPGAGMQVRIRGVGSNGNVNPLFIVDGVRTNDIDFLDPSEIASVEVLKDAASAAIYGAEGANGVIIVSTKKGKKGKTNISYDFQYGLQSAKQRMKLMNAEQYSIYLREAGATQGPPAADITDPVGTNWFDEVFEVAPMQRHSLNFSGGTDVSTFFVGGSAYMQDGVAGGDRAGFDRYSARINTSHKLKPWLTIGNNLTYSHYTRSTMLEDSEYGSVIQNTIMFDPVTPPVYTGALPAHAQAALDQGRSLIQNNAGQYYGISKYIFAEIGNPLTQLELSKGRNTVDRIAGNVYAEVSPFKDLTFTSRFNLNATFSRFQDWSPAYYYSSQKYNDFSTWNGNQSRRLEWQWENFATYVKKFNDKHNITAMLGMSAISETFEQIGGSASPLFSEDDKFAYPDYIPDGVDRVNGYRADIGMLSYFGRITYDYRNRYLLNVTVRRDGSSKLPISNRWGTFPSVSVGWVTSNEDFFTQSLVSFLKVRASWGQNGSISNLGIGQYASVITTQNLQYPTSNGFLTPAEPDFLANPELVWETSEQFDVGLDLGLFGDRLNVTADYYIKTTKDLLTLGTPPDLVGNKPSYINGGNVRNKGVELEINYRNQIGGLSFEIGGNFTAIDNEVTYLNPLSQRLRGVNAGGGWGATWFEEGFPVWYFRGYKTDGVFRDQEQINAYIAAQGLEGYNPQPGDPIVVDVNGDQAITPEDQTFIGSPHPDYIVGARISLKFKGFDFLAFAQGQTGNDVIMGFNRVELPAANKPAFFFEDRWTPDNTSAEWFRAQTGNPYAYNSDFMVRDGSYLRIRQLQLGYNLPSSLLKTVGVGSLRVYASLDDFFTFTRYPGLDPEAGSTRVQSLGIDRGVYPIPRKVMFGLSLTL